jgi:uncharacterized repeat protein (TIGR01451 family)
MKTKVLLRHSLLSFLLLLTTISLAYSQQTLNVSVSTTPACSLNGSGTATVTNGVPPYDFTWYGPAQTYATGAVNAITGVPGGSYWLYVTDANMDYGYASFTITPPFYAGTTTTDDVCNQGIGTATATVISGGTPPFTYQWSNGQTTQTATGLTAGIYEYTITDAQGCFVASSQDSMTYAWVYNSSPVSVQMSSTNSTCTDGTASVTSVTGGTAPYTYVWSTIPPQYTANVSGLAPGSYTVTVTDAGGCTGLGYVYIGQNPNGLSGNISSTPETCIQANGTASVTVTGGTLPYTYLWSNGATTQSISGLSYGSYYVTVTDALGCPKVKWVNVQRTDPLILSFTPTQPNCFNTGGALAINVNGGTPPYSYQWTNGNTTNSISNLGAGYYYCQVTDANGCTDYDYYHLTLPTNCYGTLQGRVSLDLNQNCVFDGNDVGAGNEYVQVGNQWAITNSAGYYTEQVMPGNVTITQASFPNFFALECPATGSHVVNNVLPQSVTTNLDFHDTATAAVNDLSVYIYATPARATQTQLVSLYYYNDGSVPLTATINFTHDALMSLFNGYGMSSYNLGTRTLTYNLGTVYPGQSGVEHCSFTIPINTSVGTPYCHTTEILPLQGDWTPANNVDTMCSVVVGPYDPNRKLVEPAGALDPDADTTLRYTIEFQNVGNDTAFTVAIRDTLDADLDPFSIAILGSSHPMTWDADNPGYLTFTFDNIALPDSHINEQASHGWLMYEINLKAGLAPGTEIRNTAAIYFDYNAPVITNTTVNTLELVGVDRPLPGEDGFVVWPNPATQRVHVQLAGDWDGETVVRVMDLSGRMVEGMVMRAEDGGVGVMGLSGLPRGVYLVECAGGGRREVRKLVLQ